MTIRIIAPSAKDVPDYADMLAGIAAFARFIEGRETAEDRAAEDERRRKRATSERAAQRRAAAKAAKARAEVEPVAPVALMGEEFFVFTRRPL